MEVEMKEQAIQKINKVGKISYIITVICKILVIAGLVCSVASAVICFSQPAESMRVTQRSAMIVEMSKEALGQDITDAELAEMHAALESGEQMQVQQVRNGMMGSGLNMVSTGQTFVPVAMDVTEDRVTIDMMTDGATYTMHDLAVLSLLMAVVLAMSIVTLTFIESLCKAFRNCATPFEEEVIKKMQRLAICLIPWTLISSIGDTITNSMMSGGMSWSFSVDLGVVLLVVIVLILVYIFKYGAVLQQESDETL
ncbi:MAG: DUF2975 domain-containing protein [Lachnospiraceae bacterium]|nr:DUF2975 domain-containing protein [Lachnospiraceae bacterium]